MRFKIIAFPFTFQQKKCNFRAIGKLNKKL